MQKICRLFDRGSTEWRIHKKINAQKLKRGKKKENPNAQQALSSGDIFQSYLLLL